MHTIDNLLKGAEQRRKNHRVLRLCRQAQRFIDRAVYLDRWADRAQSDGASPHIIFAALLPAKAQIKAAAKLGRLF